MRPGRKPTATATKKLAGNPGKRPLNDREPQYPAGMPECPDFLDDVARAEWYRTGPLLAKRGLLTEADRMVFAAYCRTCSRYVAACLATVEAGMETNGRRSVAVITEEHALQQLLAVAAEFGLSPSSRTRVKADTDTKPTNPILELLQSRGNRN